MLGSRGGGGENPITSGAASGGAGRWPCPLDFSLAEMRAGGAAKRGRHCCRPPVAGCRSAGPPRGACLPIWFRRQPVQTPQGRLAGVSVTGAGRLCPREDTAFPASAASSKCEQARVSRFGRFLPASAASHKERRRHRVDHGPSHCPGCEQPRRHDVFGLPLSRSFLASDRLRSPHRRPIA